ncbi:MAG: hypothetical protein PHI13_05735, partial [Methylococcales bacterium]|nr:hypothetical protein [Methylococcales bacterium]
KGKIIQKLFYDRQQILFTDFFNGTYHFESSHLINGISVIDAFLFILIALMNGINPNKALARGFFFRQSAQLWGGFFQRCNVAANKTEIF